MVAIPCGTTPLMVENAIAQAVEWYTVALEIEPDYFTAHYFRGRAYIALDMFQEALEDFNRMVELRPNFVFGYWERSVASAELGDFENANADADRAYQMDSQHVNNFISRGTIAARSGDAEEAGRQFNNLLEAYGTEAVSSEAIQSGDVVTLQMEKFKIYAITFAGEADQLLHINAHSTEADPVIVLLDVNGDPINGDDDGGISLDSLISDFQLTDAGTYTLLVSHAGGGADGPPST
jgi:tetratricopeptide (TPR) repeat protein